MVDYYHKKIKLCLKLKKKNIFMVLLFSKNDRGDRK